MTQRGGWSRLQPRPGRNGLRLHVLVARHGGGGRRRRGYVWVFMNTHLLSEVARVCTTIGVLNHGKLIYKDSIEETTRRVPDEASLQDIYLRMGGRRHDRHNRHPAGGLSAPPAGPYRPAGHLAHHDGAGRRDRLVEPQQRSRGSTTRRCGSWLTALPSKRRRLKTWNSA